MYSITPNTYSNPKIMTYSVNSIQVGIPTTVINSGLGCLTIGAGEFRLASKGKSEQEQALQLPITGTVSN